MRNLLKGFFFPGVALALVTACATGALNVRQIAINVIDVATKSLQGAADAEHVVCDPSVPLANPVLACTAGAHVIGLTDTVHQQVSGHLADAAVALGKYAAALQAGGTLPADVTVDTPLAQALSTLQAIPGIGGTVAATITALQSDINTAIADWAKVKASANGGTR